MIVLHPVDTARLERLTKEFKTESTQDPTRALLEIVESLSNRVKTLEEVMIGEESELDHPES